MGSCILVVRIRPTMGRYTCPSWKRGFDLIEAENGEEALAALAKQRPDLILMDIQLPIMDGYGLPGASGRPGDEGHPHHCSDLIRVDRR